MALSLREALELLLDGHNLDQAQASEVLVALTASDVPAALAGALLAALRAKGITAEELRGFAASMRALARRPSLPDDLEAVDIVGTGGDKSSSLNLSTGAALLAAASGASVVKHGNRSVSSRAGSADVLEALGVFVAPEQAARCFAATGFTFLFAPHYHPAMKTIAPIRTALGVRTIFNVLGPLSNPAEPPYHVIGAFDLPTAQLMAEALVGMNIKRAFVIHGAQGWDEPTPVGPFTLFDVSSAGVQREVRTPQQYGIELCGAAELAGADAAHNAAALRGVLEGEERGAHRDALVLGAALALQVTGLESEPRAAAARAAHAIESGAARTLLTRLRSFAQAPS